MMTAWGGCATSKISFDGVRVDVAGRLPVFAWTDENWGT